MIDAYDTVVRLGLTPLAKHAKLAGEKNTYVYVRDRKLRATKGVLVDEDNHGFKLSALPPEHRPKALLYGSFHRNGTGGHHVLSFGGDLMQKVRTGLRAGGL